MHSDKAAAVYGLTVSSDGSPVPATLLSAPVGMHITMAALDPTAPPKPAWNGDIPPKPRSTLKIIRIEPDDSDEEDSDYEDGDDMRYLLEGSDGDSSEEEDSDDEPNGGPSDKSKGKSKKELKAERLAELIKSVANNEDEDDEDGDVDMDKPNGTTKSKKGKEKATGSGDEAEEDESEEDDGMDIMDQSEAFVVCTLDTENTYQQPLNITIGEDEIVFFQVTGTHDIHLTGNYLAHEDSDSEDEDYDLDPDNERMLIGDSDDEEDDISDDESDELDDIDGPRVTEVDSDGEENVPALVEATPATTGKKGAAKEGKNSNKRKAADDASTLDELIAKDQGAPVSKAQAKKLKNNKGDAVAAAAAASGDDAAKPALKNGTKGDKDNKKVQFAKQLEQGPTGSTATKGKDGKAAGAPAGGKGVKVVQGVTIDDRTVGKGRAVKNGDKVGVRYIGKLQNGKVFDANKKGKPFQFTVGSEEVIKGWDVGFLGMAVGGERRLTIPPNMAYGAKGAAPAIPANATLTFDVKLIEIK